MLKQPFFHFFLAFWLFYLPVQVFPQYKTPPADVAKAAVAQEPPIVSISPLHDAMLLVDYNYYPSVATLARPFLKLAGIRVDPVLNSKQRITEYTGLSVNWFLKNKTVKIEIPAGTRISAVPQWSPDGTKIAFGVDVADGVELWAAETQTGKAWRIEGVRLNDVLALPFAWMEDSERIFVRTVPAGRGAAPPSVVVPDGPAIDETAGKQAKVMTLQDLLKNENDEKLFEYYATCQMGIVHAQKGKMQPIGPAGLHISASWSRDEKYVLMTTLRRPFSYRVQFNNFARKTEIWDATGKPLRTVAEFPVTDEIPTQGVVNGPRSFQWQPLHDARLLWIEALDGGDPKRKVENRDKLMLLDAPFSGEAKEVLKTTHRLQPIRDWLPQRDQCLLAEYDRDRRWVTSYLLDLNKFNEKSTLFDLSVQDDYNNPGNTVLDRLPNGDQVMVMDGDWAFFDCPGASPEGDFPRLDKINLKTKEKTTIWQSSKNAHEEFYTFIGDKKQEILTRYESKTEVPNFFRVGLQNRLRQPLTNFADPAPELARIEKRLVKYTRKDGTPLSGTLLLPSNYKPGQKLPLFIWAYPLEYSDKSTAGQVRGSENTYTKMRGDDPEFFVTQGYAVLMDATIPIVGDPETMNNTFVEQTVSSGRAAIDYLDSLGIIDREKVGVGGHSYGAFMTANLLAHSDDYAFGIARSGAYNRTLTPFGFQSERRSFWEAKDVYMTVSPFYWADQINEPLLIVHGDADNNPGTHTLQSERLFQAMKGTGGTARLVLLPHESHGYRARESVLHVLAESFDWAQKHGTRKVKRP